MCHGNHLWTCPENNSSVAGWHDGKPVVVEQGPKWLAELAYGGPEWLPMLLNLAFLALVAAVIIYVLERGVTVEQAVGVVENAVLVGTVMLLSYIARDGLALPYVVDVAVGGVGGFVVSALVFRAVEDRVREQLRDAILEPTGRANPDDDYAREHSS